MLKKFIAAAAIAVVTAGSANAATFLDFTVDPLVTGATSGGSTFVADKITGNYTEVISFDGLGGFNVSLLWQAGQFVANDGNTPLTGLQTGLGNNYGLYGLVYGAGTVTPLGGGKFEFKLTSGSVALWHDDYDDGTTDPIAAGVTTFTNPAVGGGAFGIANFLDDTKIADGTVVSPSGGILDPSLATCDPGINCGSFGQTNTVVLTTPFGKNFFTQPIPFYTLAFESGQLNTFEVAGTQTINGSLDLVFQQVPEPSSLALAGLALVGLGFAARRNKKA